MAKKTPEKFRPPSPDELSERATLEQLKQEGGIFYHEELDSETNEKVKLVNILGIDVPTHATPEDIATLKSEIVLSNVDQEMLRAIAESYELRQPLLFEGRPGTGKTFLMKKFAQFIHGKDAPIVELVGTPRTSELEILGHWAPKGMKKEQTARYQEALKNLMGEGEEFGALREQLDQALKHLNSQLEDKAIKVEEFRDLFGDITTTYIDEARKVALQAAQLAGLASTEAEWEFKEGALLQAYVGREGQGNILIVDEFNMIPANYQQIFLQIGGEQGKLNDTISFWGNSGKSQYKRGPDTWVCFASNFPETTPGRSEVVAPMTDRLVWKVIPDEASEKKKSIITRTAGGRLKRRSQEVNALHELQPASIPLKEQIDWTHIMDEQLGEQVADIVELFDAEFVKNYQQLGDQLSIEGEKRRRTQQLEFSARNALRLYSYLDHFQVRDEVTGKVDMAATLINAFERYYINRLADNDARNKARINYHEILRGVTGQIKFEGKATTREEVLKLLVGRAVVSPENQVLADKEEAERQKHIREQIKFTREDKADALLNNPAISESIKQKLKALEDKIRKS